MQNNASLRPFAYEKKRWDSSHKEPNIQVGDLVLISTVHFNNLNVNAKLKDPFIGPFLVIGLVGTECNQGGTAWGI